MRITILNVLVTFLICITNGQYNFEFEFLEEGIYKPCENYPDMFLDKIFDLSNAQAEQIENGNMHVKGYVILKTTIKQPQPLVLEVFKKERGTWLPTLISLKRPDLCTAVFDPNENWHSDLNNTPIEQHICPLTEGQRVDFEVEKPTIYSLPIRNNGGEYNIHVEIGDKNSDTFICSDVFVIAHKV